MHVAKTVQLSDEAYARLTAEKADRESYSDVVLRLTGDKGPMRFVGRLKIRADFDEVTATMRRAEARDRRLRT
jgi:predicted CopG family antitoxin